jgi:hypothetical protein
MIILLFRLKEKMFSMILFLLHLTGFSIFIVMCCIKQYYIHTMSLRTHTVTAPYGCRFNVTDNCSLT